MRAPRRREGFGQEVNAHHKAGRRRFKDHLRFGGELVIDTFERRSRKQPNLRYRGARARAGPTNPGRSAPASYCTSRQSPPRDGSDERDLVLILIIASVHHRLEVYRVALVMLKDAHLACQTNPRGKGALRSSCCGRRGRRPRRSARGQPVQEGKKRQRFAEAWYGPLLFRSRCFALFVVMVEAAAVRQSYGLGTLSRSRLAGSWDRTILVRSKVRPILVMVFTV